jgi:hypothetical protein
LASFAIMAWISSPEDASGLSSLIAIPYVDEKVEIASP